MPIDGARKSARPSDTLGRLLPPPGHPFGTHARHPRPVLPTPSLKASGELEEKVPRVYTHIRSTIFSESRRARGRRGRLGLCGGDSRRPRMRKCVHTKPFHIHLHSDIVR